MHGRHVEAWDHRLPEPDRWLNDIRDGNRNAHREVLVHLQNEDHTAIVQTCKLKRARIIKHISGPMDAKGADVAIEELTLVCDRLEMEWRPRRSCDVE